MVLACTLTVSWSAEAGSSYLAVWSSDKPNDDQRLNTDFLAIIDADPRSATYGKVVNTAALQRTAGANLLNDLGFTGPLGLTTKYNLPAKGIPSNVLNEAHHMSHEPIAVGRHRYLYLGGLISANVFRCDVADPLNIPNCPLVTTAKDVRNFSGIDDFAQAAQRQPAGHLHGCQEPHHAGRAGRAAPGRLGRRRVRGGQAGRPGPLHAERQRGHRYRPARPSARHRHPAGPGPRRHGGLRRAAQPRDAASVGSGTEDLGTTVRFWKLSDLEAGPTAIAQLPVGKGRERLSTNNAPEGRHVGGAPPPAQAQGRVRRDHGRRLDLVRARRHGARSRSSA